MEDEKIEVPLYLGSKVQKRLKEKYGIETSDKCFTKKELNLVDKLTIVPPLEGGLIGIEYLSNLESLYIQSIGNTSFQTKIIPSITDADIYSISKCKKLKNLEITNQSNIECIDCSVLQGLTTLIVKNNRKLRKINGLEKLTKLDKLICYGNGKLCRLEKLDEAILNNPDLYNVELDLLLYPDAIGYDISNGLYNKQAFDKLEKTEKVSKAVFVESMLKKEVNIEFSKMKNFHNMAIEILRENNIDGSKSEIIDSISKYISKNIKYNESVIDDKDINLDEKQIIGARRCANGAYSAIVNKKGDCEGCTRAMQYLLKLKGIDSQNVYCQKNSENVKQYHSVVLLEDNNYSDPGDNAYQYQQENRKIELSIKSREQMKKIYKFDGVHMDLEITNDMLRELGARITRVVDIQKQIEKDLNKDIEKEKEDLYIKTREEHIRGDIRYNW